MTKTSRAALTKRIKTNIGRRTSPTVSSVKSGTWIQLKENGPMFIREHYDRETKKYCLSYFDDVGRCRFVKGTAVCIADATF